MIIIDSNIDDNAKVDQFAYENKLFNDDNNYYVIPLDINILAKFNLREPLINKSFQIYEVHEDRTITKMITRLKIAHFKGIRINKDGKKTYNCLQILHVG